MSTTRESGLEPQVPPVFEIYRAFKAADAGQMPSFTPASLLDELGLQGETPDGLTLIDRLTGNSRSVSAFRAIIPLILCADALIQATNEYRANPAQETIAQALGAVVARQVTREDDICPGAKVIALGSTREDIIPADVKAVLARPERDRIGVPRAAELEDAIIRGILNQPALFGEWPSL